MQLHHAVKTVTTQLADSLEMISDVQYSRPSSHLGNATVGQHVRHIIEMFQCLLEGYDTGRVNYEQRKRDQRIETDRLHAIGLLMSIHEALERPNRHMLLEGAYHDDSEAVMTFETNYLREVVYTLEHAIHHMALIRVGYHELTDLELPETFGVASATVKHKRTCAQ